MEIHKLEPINLDILKNNLYICIKLIVMTESEQIEEILMEASAMDFETEVMEIGLKNYERKSKT
jgi:hypothetical protein